MTVKDLIAALEKQPPDAKVKVIWDGAARTEVEVVYFARNGSVMLAETGDTVYGDDERPEGAQSDAYGNWHAKP